MADERIQTAKESKCANRLKVFRLGSQSTPQSRSNSPPPFGAPESKFANRLKRVFRLGLQAQSRSNTQDEAAKLRAKYTHFRILIIGRANAGKTTLLKRVCNTREDPVYNRINPTDERGIHNVRDEFTFKSNPGFIFHDSPGFEAGGEDELQAVMSFVEDKAKAQEVGDQIHAIWFCFEPDVSRPLLELEKKFFNEQRAGNIPVVAIFTKFDILFTRVYDRKMDKEKNLEIAHATLKEKFEKPLRSYAYPPCAYVRFESIQEGDKGNHQEQVGELVKEAAASIDDFQQNNLEICIKCAVNSPYV